MLQFFELFNLKKNNYRYIYIKSLKNEVVMRNCALGISYSKYPKFLSVVCCRGLLQTCRIWNLEQRASSYAYGSVLDTTYIQT